MKANGALGTPETRLLLALVRHHDRFMRMDELVSETGLTEHSVGMAVKRVRFFYGYNAIVAQKRSGYRVNPKVWESFKEAS